MNAQKNLIDDFSIHTVLSHTEQAFKDSLENSINITKDHILIPDSLNNTMIKTFVLNKNDESFQEKEIKLGQCNLKDFNKRVINHSNASSIEQSLIQQEEQTKKIQYKYMSNYNLTENYLYSKEKKYFWFAAYDKLINTKNMKKILVYYSTSENDPCIANEKAIIIKDFELNFSSKMYINRRKDSFIFVKLYYLPIEDINKIFNYINKIEHVLQEDSFTFVNSLGNTSIINHKGKQYPYSNLCNLGSFLNVNIYSFTSSTENNPNGLTVTKSMKTHRLSKMVKYLSEVFPCYSSDFFISYFYENSNCCLKNQGKSMTNEQKVEIQKYLRKRNESKNAIIMKNNYKYDVKVTNQIISANKEIQVDVNTHSKKNTESLKQNKTACSSFSASISKAPLITKTKPTKVMNGKHITVQSFNLNQKQKPICNRMINTSTIKMNNSSASENKPNISGVSSFTRNNNTIQNPPSINKKNSIYVVNRKLKSDEFDFDDDSSINTSKPNNNNEQKVFVTPTKKKSSKYYS